MEQCNQNETNTAKTNLNAQLNYRDDTNPSGLTTTPTTSALSLAQMGIEDFRSRPMIYLAFQNLREYPF